MLIATQQLRSPTGNFQHNYNRMAVTTRPTISLTAPPIVASATSSDGGGGGSGGGGGGGGIAAANIKQEPDIAGEVTLNR
jgi:uncharacterized membrane protein